MPFITDWLSLAPHQTTKCEVCGAEKVVYRVYESSNEEHTDIQYCCLVCKAIWWVDGTDY